MATTEAFRLLCCGDLWLGFFFPLLSCIIAWMLSSKAAGDRHGAKVLADFAKVALKKSRYEQIFDRVKLHAHLEPAWWLLLKG